MLGAPIESVRWVARIAIAVWLSTAACAAPPAPGSPAAAPTATQGLPVAPASQPAATPCVSAVAVVALAEQADAAMREIGTATTLGQAHAAAARAANALRQLLPSDADGPPDGAVAALVARSGAAAADLDETALGGLVTWSSPRTRYDEWRAVLAEWRPDRNTMPRLPSHLLRALGWATLVSQSQDVASARDLAGTHGVIHTRLVLDAARAAVARPRTACP